jgi:hypothetical protein
MMKTKYYLFTSLVLCLTFHAGCTPAPADNPPIPVEESSVTEENPYLGYWALTIPGGRAGWLGVEEKDGQLEASILWGGGSVVPTDSALVEDGQLIVTRIHKPRKKDAKPVTETITAIRKGDHLKLTTVKTKADGTEMSRADFSGSLQPPLPPAPDLSRVKFGDPIVLFNGEDLTGWKIIGDRANGWKAEDGVLMNRTSKGKPWGNLRTEQEFEDFNLKLEVRVPEKGNSGIYLRGIYEVQVFESHGKPVNNRHMGAIYSRIAPTVAAEKPMNEWQTMDITLVDRHVTVILNGQTIIDNQPLIGCTGSALHSDVTRPGPIHFQGDHTDIEYRNIVLRPVVK